MRITVRRSPAVTRIAATALAAVGLGGVVIGAAGCGSSSSSIDPVAQAATVSNAAAGYKLAMNMTMAMSQLPKPIRVTGTGSFTPAKRQGSMTLNFDASSIPSFGQALGGSNLAFEELIDGTTFYMKFPASLASKIPGGKTWMKFDLVKLGKSGGIPGISSLLNNPTSGNPAQLLQYLRASSGGVTKVGTAQIDGVSTTEYKGTVQLDKYPSLLPSSQQTQAKQAIDQLESLTKIKSIPVTVWVDDQHLVRQMAMSFTETLPNSGQSVSLQMQMRISDYGPQPTPAYPSADQVLDASALLSGLSAAGSGSGSTTP